MDKLSQTWFDKRDVYQLKNCLKSSWMKNRNRLYILVDLQTL